MFYILHESLQLLKRILAGWLFYVRKETQPIKPIRIQKWSWTCFIKALTLSKGMYDFNRVAGPFPLDWFSKNQEANPHFFTSCKTNSRLCTFRTASLLSVIPQLELLWDRRFCPHQDFLSPGKKPQPETRKSRYSSTHRIVVLT